MGPTRRGLPLHFPSSLVDTTADRIQYDIVILLAWEVAVGLGDLQQMTMLAVARLGEDAFAKAVREELRQIAGREVSVSTVYVTLVRLEDQGLVASETDEPDPAKGGRGKRFFRITPAGWAALNEARASMQRLWDGVEPA